MQMLDKNYNKLEIGDKVLLFGMIGTVYQDTNALGLFFEEGIDWKLVKSNMTKIQGCKKEIYFSHQQILYFFLGTDEQSYHRRRRCLPHC